ncbi:Cullin-associated NEDD8-dissociated protein [Arachis hypogaea]|uniref:Cullin-associated NEDD8-dissociated protein n=1 Tax=Arachis hypogaea TaxID=3818 RepID=A0A6B9VAM8_ARAHY|nr:Cullin-associated NEDD8-dissociated protein [Arachis hypogaea]
MYIRIGYGFVTPTFMSLVLYSSPSVVPISDHRAPLLVLCSSPCAIATALLLSVSRGRWWAEQHLALLCLGEIGRRKDLSAHAHIENIVIESFQSPFEEIKSAASYALGNIAVGNLPKNLPFILDQIDN